MAVPTAVERIEELRRHGHTSAVIAAILGIDRDDLETWEADPTEDAPVVVGGGEGPEGPQGPEGPEGPPGSDSKFWTPGTNAGRSETLSRFLFQTNDWHTLDSGYITLTGGLVLSEGQAVSEASLWVQGDSNPAVEFVHHWVALLGVDLDSSPLSCPILAISDDREDEAWAPGDEKVFEFTTPYVPPADMPAYIGVLVASAGTMPRLQGRSFSGYGNVQAQRPSLTLQGYSTLTDPASCPDPVPVTGATGGIYAVVR